MRKLIILALLASCVGCAGTGKACSQMGASAFGSDWIIVQYRQDGTAFHCWKVRDAAVDSGQGGNIDWKDRQTGHLMHITGWENRIQVAGGDFETAGRLVGVDSNLCGNGIYPVKEQTRD